MRKNVRAGTAACLSALAIFAIVQPVAAQIRKVPEALMTSTGQQGHQRVIILMASPQEGGRQEAARQPERYFESQLQGTARLVRGILNEPMVVADVTREGLLRLERDSSVRRVVPDTLMTAFLPESTKLLHAPEGWSQNVKGSGVSVAILDTGVQRDHPFIAKHIVAEACFSSNTPADSSSSLCPNGQQEQIGAGAAAACDVSTSCVHGTHVAGIAAGSDGHFQNATLEGVAPAANIVAIQVFSKIESEERCGKGHAPCVTAWTSDIIRGLLLVERMAPQYKIAAVNLSLGGGKFDSACDSETAYTDVFKRLTQKGVAVVVASGNNGYVGAVTEPACITSAIAVGAVKKDNTIDTRYSNTSNMVSLVAPGTQILSSAAGSYDKLSGTSMAAPHITGLFALLKAKYPQAPVDKLLQAIQTSGERITDPRSNQSFVLPNVQAVLAALDADKTAPAPQPAQPPQPTKPTPDPRVPACGPVCIENGKGTRRVIFVLANRDAVAKETLDTLRKVFGQKAKVEDIGDGKLTVELPEGTTSEDVDRARKGIGDDTKVFPDRPLETLPSGGTLIIR